MRRVLPDPELLDRYAADAERTDWWIERLGRVHAVLEDAAAVEPADAAAALRRSRLARPTPPHVRDRHERERERRRDLFAPFDRAPRSARGYQSTITMGTDCESA